jgi:hypothetical protein
VLSRLSVRGTTFPRPGCWRILTDFSPDSGPFIFGLAVSYSGGSTGLQLRVHLFFFSPTLGNYSLLQLKKPFSSSSVNLTGPWTIFSYRCAKMSSSTCQVAITYYCIKSALFQGQIRSAGVPPFYIQCSMYTVLRPAGLKVNAF